MATGIRLLVAGVVFSVAGAAAWAQEKGAEAGGAESAFVVRRSAPGEEATLEIWNRPIFVFRAYSGNLSPQQRVDVAHERLEALSYRNMEGEIATVRVAGAGTEGLIVSVDGRTVFTIVKEDLDPTSGETLDAAGATAVQRLREALDAELQQRRLPVILRGLGLSGLATLALVAAIVLVWLVRRLVLRRLRETPEHLARLKLFEVDLAPYLVEAERQSVRVLAWVLWLTAVYVWLTFVLSQFPYSDPWSVSLAGFLVSTVGNLASGVAGAMPGVVTVLIIFLVTRFFVRLVRRLFVSVETGALSVPWLQPESARATRRLVTLLMWAFAVTVAYPYIPGSSTDAFKGVSVLIGLMISLGSTGVVNQIMSGLVVVYSQAVQRGDYVRFGEVEGVVTELGLLSTKVVTPKREEINIPNSLLVSDTTTNYTRLAGKGGSIASTAVTIGYDVPWRQVHALLVLAAGQTPRVRKEPPPRVLQRSLADFYVEYHLLVHLERPEDRPVALSDLNARIQDAFNEYGVQIMSPHFLAQPGQSVVVPKDKWHQPPASPDAQNEAPAGDAAKPEGSG